jgi:hypothetical protein
LRLERNINPLLSEKAARISSRSVSSLIMLVRGYGLAIPGRDGGLPEKYVIRNIMPAAFFLRLRMRGTVQEPDCMRDILICWGLISMWSSDWAPGEVLIGSTDIPVRSVA